MKAKILILTALIPMVIQANASICNYYIDRFKKNHAKARLELERKSKSIYANFALSDLENMMVECELDKETEAGAMKLRKKLMTQTKY